MRKTTITTIICVLVILLSTACGDSNGGEEPMYTLGDLLDIAHERRLDIIANRPTHEQLLELTQGREPETIDLTLFVSDNTGQAITASEAIEDVELFFMALRQIYGPYIYFGGDAVFVPVFDEIIAEIATHETILPFQLENILLHALSPIINDNHFMLGSNWLGQNATFFTSTVHFDRDERGFIHRESGRVVAEIEGRNVYDVLRLSMDEQGNIFYSAVIYELGPVGLARRNLSVVFDNGDNLTLPLEQHQPAWRPFNSPSLEWVEDVPVVTSMSMGITVYGQFSVEYAEAFLSLSDEVHNEPIVIVDLRNNHGGDSLLGSRWLYQLTGEIVPLNLTELHRLTYEEMMEQWQISEYHDPRGRDFNSLEVYRYFSRVRVLDNSHIMAHHVQARTIIDSNHLIILLVDSFTRSAPEHFVDMVLGMGNTLVIGQNTFGAVINRGHSPLALPNSGIFLMFGRAVRIFPQGYFAEGVGLAPDIWVHGDSLAAALSLIGNNRDE